MIKSKAQAKYMYKLWKEGKITYKEMMDPVHKVGDMSKLPERTKGRPSKKAIDLAI